MGYAILRIAKRKTTRSAAAMSVHAFRETPVPNAIAGAPPPEVIAGATTTAEVMAKLKAGIAHAKTHGGPQGFTKASVPVLDILVTTSAEDPKRMGKAGQDDYFKRALSFIAAKFGGMANILTAAIHRDETTPHMQVLVMPLDRETNRFAAAKMIGGPKGLSALQDAFHADVGKRHGLKRGEKGSKARHVPVKQLYAAMNEGMDAPKFQSVPPAPGMVDRLKPGYQEKKKAREDALAANAKIRKKIEQQAKTGRMMHPEMVARQAERYRENVRQEALLATQKTEAYAAKSEARNELERVQKKLDVIIEATHEMRLQSQAVDRLWEKAGAKVLDKWTPHMAPEMVKRVAAQLGIELVAGKPLLDQMRRQGRGSTLIECAERLDKALDGALHVHVQSGQAQRDIERPKPP